MSIKQYAVTGDLFGGILEKFLYFGGTLHVNAD
jgi:hypothetical protein